MKLEIIQPREELKPYISKIWLFESHYTLAADNSLIAPNAKPKIILSYKNTLATTHDEKTTICKENDLCFVGIRDVPVTLSSPPGKTGTIGIELTTSGAYKFLHVPMSVLTNNLFSFHDVYDALGKELIRSVADHEDPKQKIRIIQDFLFQRLIKGNRNNTLVDYAVNLITSRNGLIEIKELERKTGYTKRYLDYLFKDHLGISPKTFSTILRFQKFYKNWIDANHAYFEKGDIYELYYDQSHFIKEFKRYTGHSPMKFATLKNEFGRNF